MFPNVTQYRLGNGLDVILAPSPGSPRVAVDILFDGGAENEKPGQSGFAHLFEHMAARGSKHIDKKTQNAVLSAIGANKEAMTSFDQLEFYVVAPANQLETLLWFRSDQTGFSAQQVSAEALKVEKEVVSNELRQRGERAFGRAHARMYQRLFPAPHPYHAGVGGTPDDVARASVEDVRRFFETYFTPNRMTLVIAGGFELEAGKKLVEKYFGDIRRGPDAANKVAAAPPLSAEIRDTVHERGAAPRLTIAWAVPAPYAADREALDVVPFLLGRGPASLLERRLVHELSLADTVKCTLLDARASSILYCDIALRAGASLETVEREVDKVFAQLSEGAGAANVERAKTAWRADLIRGIEDLLGRARTLASYYFYARRTDYFAEDLQRHAAVTEESLRQAAARWLDPRRRVVVVSTPVTE